jgi:two-component system, chemotaxis family, protein-glutamate methylesterase/glutaminase
VTRSLPATQDIEAVAIGASAGGVEVLSTLLSVLPAGCRASFFIVMHIPRERPSLLAEVFAARCALPVREAEDKEPVQPGTVYFAPPDYHLLLDRGPAFALSSDEPVHFSRPSIDVLFDSAADIYGERLLGLILTGANQDGAARSCRSPRARPCLFYPRLLCRRAPSTSFFRSHSCRISSRPGGRRDELRAFRRLTE